MKVDFPLAIYYNIDNEREVSEKCLERISKKKKEKPAEKLPYLIADRPKPNEKKKYRKSVKTKKCIANSYKLPC